MPLDIQAWQELSIDTPFDRIRYVIAEIASQILDEIEYIFSDYHFARYGIGMAKRVFYDHKIAADKMT